jgi:steroid 5-alpha reductase family enzyme
LDYLSFLIWIIGFLIETISDCQKNSFRSISSNSEKFIQSGLWQYSRHPNYLGEILMWLSVAASCQQQYEANRQMLGWLSPVFTVFLLMKVSGIPRLEEQADKKWGSQKEY